MDYRVSSAGIIYAKWHDNRIVHVISNFHGSVLSKVQRKQKDDSIQEVNCPEIIPDYNKHMGAVDLADRLRQAYCVERKSKKWWHRLFFGLIDMVFVNSFVIYKKLKPDENISLLDYQRGVSCGLIKKILKPGVNCL